MFKQNGKYGERIDAPLNCHSCGKKCPHSYANIQNKKFCSRTCYEKGLKEASDEDLIVQRKSNGG